MVSIYEKIKKNYSTYLFIFFSIIFYIVLLLGSQDNDMFFEIMSGRDLLKGNFKTATHLNNFPIIVQQWLYSVCLAIADNFGYIGHISIVLFQNLALIAISYIFIYMKTHNKKLSLFAPFFAILYCSEYMINIRPQIITMFFLVSELIVIEKYKETKKINYLFLLFPLLILSANFHQGIFWYHIIILAPYYFNKNSNNKTSIDLKLVFITPFLSLCSLCTPYGLDGFLYIFRTFLSKTYMLYTINELEPISIKSFIGIKLLIILIITIILIYNNKSNIFINTYVFGITLLSLISVRHIIILYIAILFIICVIDIKKLNNNFIKNGITFLVTLLIIILLNNAYDISNINNVKNTNYININNIITDKEAKIYNTSMELGGYLEYCGYTKIRIDSRCEAFSEEISGVENVNKEQYALTTGYLLDKNLKASFASNEDLLNMIKDYDYLIAKKYDYINRVVVNENNWKLIYSDNNYQIYEQIY